MADLSERVRASLAGRYTIERELGRGGMATVYLARDLKHDRPVALKVLRPELAAVLGAERFLREIRLTAQLQHPHILTLIDSGEADGFLYYVMPYVEGESLRQRLEREGQLPLDEALRITGAIASALDFAHGRGVIHRDIKPENIMLHQGEPMVADFGIALAVSMAGRERLTETGLSLGTPAYMSPEQASAEPRLDGRSDQYSLASVLYEMLGGEPPYTGPTAQAIIAKRFSEPVPHLGTLRTVPPHVEGAVTRALAKSPADRFATLAAFAAALIQPTSETESPRPHRFWRRHPAGTIAGVLSLAAIVVLVGLKLPRRQSAAVMPSQRQVTFSARANEPALSPDGRTLAYVSDGRALVLEPLGGGESVILLRSHAWIAGPRWSPDGQWLYFTMLRDAAQSAAIYRIPARGGAPVKVLDALGPIDLSPDGRTLARTAGDSVILDDPLTGVERTRFSAQPSSLSSTDSLLWGLDSVPWSQHVAWSPDGQWIATSRWVRGVVVTRSDGRWSSVVARDRFGPVRWSPTGAALYYLRQVPGGSELLRLPFDPRTGTARPEERVVFSGIPVSRAWRDLTFDLGGRGSTLAYVGGPVSQHVWAFRLEAGHDTAVARRLSVDSRAYDWPAVSADGATLAVMQYDAEGRGNFFVASMDGGDFVRFTDDNGLKSNPSWGPDGARFAYVLMDSAGSRLILQDRSGQRLQIGATAPAWLSYFRTTWSADGRLLLYPARKGRTLVVLDVAQGSEAIISAVDSITPFLGAVLSPDGREVFAAGMHRPEEGFRLWRTSVGRGVWTRVSAPPGDNIPLLWRRDGWIYLFNDRYGANRMFRGANPAAIWRMRADGGRQELVAWLPAECRLGFVSMSGDGRRLACAVLHQEPDIWLVSNFDAAR